MSDYREADQTFYASNDQPYLGVWVDEVEGRNGGKFRSYKLKIQKRYKKRDGTIGTSWEIYEKEIPYLLECLWKAHAWIDMDKKRAAERKQEVTTVVEAVSFEHDDINF